MCKMKKGPERMCQIGLAGGAINARGENLSEIEVSFPSPPLSHQQWILALF